jgi:hypothetical protein
VGVKTLGDKRAAICFGEHVTPAGTTSIELPALLEKKAPAAKNGWRLDSLSEGSRGFA